MNNRRAFRLAVVIVMATVYLGLSLVFPLWTWFMEPELSQMQAILRVWPWMAAGSLFALFGAALWARPAKDD